MPENFSNPQQPEQQPEQPQESVQEKLDKAVLMADELLRNEQERLKALETIHQEQAQKAASASEAEVGQFPKGAETAEPEAAAMVELRETEKETRRRYAVGDPVILDKATKDAEFAKFLVRYEDAAGLNFQNPKDAAKVVERYEDFENAQKITENLGVLYKGELREKFGIRISEKNTAGLKDYFLKEAVSNPDKALGLMEKIATYEGLKEQIPQLEKQIEELGGDEGRKKAVEQLKNEGGKLLEIKEEAKNYIGWKGFVGAGVSWNPTTWWKIVANKNVGGLGELLLGSLVARTEEETALRQEVRGMTAVERTGFFAGLDEKIALLQKRAQGVESLPERVQQAKELFANARRDFFVNFEANKVFAGLVSERVNRKIHKLVNEGYKGNDIKKLEDAQEYIDLVRSGSEALALPVELKLRHGKSKVAKTLSPDQFNARLETKIEKMATAMVHEKLDSVPIGNTAMNSLYEAAKSYLERPELGSKDVYATKEFFVSVLDKYLKAADKKSKNLIKAADKQIQSLSNLEKRNKKLGKAKRLTPQEAENKIQELIAQKEDLENQRKTKALLLNVAIGKLLNS